MRWIKVDPHLRGHVSPALLERMRSAGMHVHRVGSAAYVHDDAGQHRWLLGVWADDVTPPAWASRLDAHHRWLMGRGSPTPLEARRARAFAVAWGRRRLRSPRTGRFVPGVYPWWKVRADW